MMGRIMNERTMMAFAALKTFAPNVSWRIGLMTMSAKIPNTIDGMPARSSIAGFSTARTRGFANSLR